MLLPYCGSRIRFTKQSHHSLQFRTCNYEEWRKLRVHQKMNFRNKPTKKKLIYVDAALIYHFFNDCCHSSGILITQSKTQSTSSKPELVSAFANSWWFYVVCKTRALSIFVLFIISIELIFSVINWDLFGDFWKTCHVKSLEMCITIKLRKRSLSTDFCWFSCFLNRQYIC